MRVGDIIDLGNVVVGLRVSDKGQLLHELASRAGRILTLDPWLIFDALQAREQLGSTGLGKGFALPHARLEALNTLFALFVRLARPIEFTAIDGLPVDLVVLLLTPASMANEHLALLATLARPLRDERFLQRLRAAPDANTLHQLLADV